MSLKNLFISLKARMPANVLFCQMWNNQYRQLLEPDGQGIYGFPLPAVFIEFDAPKLSQLGNGVQIYDPLKVRMHIIMEELNATDADSQQEQNLTIYDLVDSIIAAFQLFEPQGAVAMVATEQTQDDNHTNIYHFIQDFDTNYVVTNNQQPINGTVTTPPTTLVLDATTTSFLKGQ